MSLPPEDHRTNSRWVKHDELRFFKGVGIACLLAIPVWAIIIAIIYQVLKAKQ